VSDGPTSVIGLVLVGHHPLTLCGLSQVFEKEADCSVLAVCTDAEATVEVVRRHQPDVLILDLDRSTVFKVLRRVQRARLGTRVVVLASASDNDIADAVQLGASGVILKELPPEAFVLSVRKIYREDQAPNGHADVSRLVTRLSRPATSARHARPLTPRETEIARLAVLGIPTREIADRLAVKQGTVKIHLHSIYEKLNVGGRLGLVIFARRHGLA
jgi:DNA-binding NarL/FixJ family response regulator